MFCSWPGPRHWPVSPMRQRERLGDEHVLDHDVVGAGAAQADDVPDVDDRVVLARDHEGLEVDDVAVGVEDQPAEQHPRAVVAAGGEAPLAGQGVAALGDDGLARRGVRRAQPGAGVLAPDGLLRLVGEQRDLPRVDADHAGDPAGRAAGARDVAHGGVEVDRVGLEAVEALGLEELEEAGVLELLDVGLGDDPEPLGLLRPLPERGQQVTDPVEHRLGHRTLLQRLSSQY